jgi:quinol monooxygenase YgiN
MIARLVEMVVKPGAASDLANVIERQALPLLRESPGLHDYLVLVLKDEPRIVIIQSFWDDLEGVNHFEREVLPRIRPLTQPFVVGEPRTRVFNVTCSTEAGEQAGPTVVSKAS